MRVLRARWWEKPAFPSVSRIYRRYRLTLNVVTDLPPLPNSEPPPPPRAPSLPATTVGDAGRPLRAPLRLRRACCCRCRPCCLCVTLPARPLQRGAGADKGRTRRVERLPAPQRLHHDRQGHRLQHILRVCSGAVQAAGRAGAPLAAGRAWRVFPLRDVHRDRTVRHRRGHAGRAPSAQLEPGLLAPVPRQPARHRILVHCDSPPLEPGTHRSADPPTC